MLLETGAPTASDCPATGHWQQEHGNSAESQVLTKDIQSQAMAEHRNLPGKKMQICLNLFS